MRKNLSLTAIICGLGLLLGNLLAQDLTITQAGFTETGSFQVRFAAETNGVYFRLLAAGSPIENYSLVGVWVPNSSLPLLTDPQPEIAARFYRVEAVPLDAATDTDSDGMPDWFELANFPNLDPNYPGDSVADLDNDGRSNLSEFVAETSPNIPEPDASVTMSPPRLACGNGFTVALKQDGTLWGWGDNRLGQVGDDSKGFKAIPQQISSATNWSMVATGVSHAAAINADGLLYCWGNNQFGELGDGSFENKSIPQLVGTGRWKWVTAGVNYTMAIHESGTLWGWGGNAGGRIGRPDVQRTAEPVQIGTATNWFRISAGAYHTLALQTDGSLWAWGWNWEGALGLILTNASTAEEPVRVGNDRDWRAISAGIGTYKGVVYERSYSLAIRRDGSIWGWGKYPPLGSVTLPKRLDPGTNWRQVFAGSAHAIAIAFDGSIWGMGDNTFGATGLGVRSVTTTFSQIDNLTWTAAAAGGKHTMALNRNGALVGWGSNTAGELGTGEAFNPLVPQQVGMETNWSAVAAGEYHSAAIRADGTLWTWGSASSNQLGIVLKGRSDFARFFPTQVGNDSNWKQIVAGDYHTVGLKTDGSLWAWGANTGGQLGIGSLKTSQTPVQVQPGTAWIQVTAGGFRTMAIRSDGSLWAWGDGSYGLGDGTQLTRSAPIQIGTNNHWREIQIGGVHSMGIQTDGSLWGWGLSRATGTDRDQGRLVPTLVAPGRVWKAVALDGSFTLGIQEDGTLWGWGSNSGRQLGLFDNLLAGRVPLLVSAETDWASIATGEAHGIGIRTDGSLWAWGWNSDGQLGLGSSANAGLAPPRQIGQANDWKAAAGGEYHSLAIKHDGTLWSWGSHSRGQLGNSAPRQVVGGLVWASP